MVLHVLGKHSYQVGWCPPLSEVLNITNHSFVIFVVIVLTNLVLKDSANVPILFAFVWACVCLWLKSMVA